MSTTALRRSARAVLRPLVLAVTALAVYALPAAAQPGNLFAGIEEIAEYRMTAEVLGRFLQATEALQTLEDDEVDLRDHIDLDSPETLDIGTIAAALDREPLIHQAIVSAGITTMEYVTFLMATLQAVFASVMIQFGGEEMLAGMPEGALKHNVQFLLDHQDAFEALGDF